MDAAVPVVKYVLLSVLPSAFKNCEDVPPDFINELAVMFPSAEIAPPFVNVITGVLLIFEEKICTP